MPYESVKVPAEILLEYKGYTVYRSYDHGEIENPLDNWYEFEEDGDYSFDIRDLPNYGFKITDDSSRKEYMKNHKLANSRAYHADVIREAIEHRYLDDIIKKSGLKTLAEQTWPENLAHCEFWQMKQFIGAVMAAQSMDDYKYVSLEDLYKVIREQMIKEDVR